MDLRDQLHATLGDAYTLERELTGGGMSRVFVAEEQALGRKIVVKVLPADTAGGVSAERFKREIQVAARLQHPLIVPLLSAGNVDGLPFYTMPFVKGESLRGRLTRSGELPLNEALHILHDVAAALAYAHGEGVVHRDIKPDNVMLSGGVAVVTDFGVSKAMNAATQSEAPQSGITSLGVALGTPAYMSPEQASADPHIDHRADIYSFGCVAYELLAGSSPFAGRSPQQLLAAHVTEAPEPLLKRRPNLPPALAALVMKCLEKRAVDRPQSAAEVLNALDELGTPSGGMTPTLATRLIGARSNPIMRRVAIGASVAALAAVIVLVVVVLGARRARPLSIGATTPIAVAPELQLEPAISPDGKLVAYAAQTPAGLRIFVRQIDGGRANLLTGDLDGDHRWPQWSPDGSRISFTAKGGIYVVPALGGTPKPLVERGTTHVWSPDGKQIIYATAHLPNPNGATPGDVGQGISAQPVKGGPARIIVRGPFLYSPSVSPDGRLLAYVEGRSPAFTNLSPDAVWIVPVAGGTPTRLSDSTNTNVSPVWMPDGRSILYVSSLGGGRDVYQQPVHPDGRAAGALARLTTGLSPFTITLSRDGSRMAYDVVHPYSNIWVVPISAGAASSTSAALQVTREDQHIEGVALSHDGKWLAYDSDRGGNYAEIYKLRLDGGDPVQLTADSANDFSPDWSPDDKEIAFHTNRNGTRQIYVMSAEGSGEQQVTNGATQDYYPRWSPDGRQLVYQSDSGAMLSLVTRNASGQWSAPHRLADSSRATIGRSWSPKGDLIAYTRAGAVAVVPSAGGPPHIVADRNTLGGTAGFVTWGRDASTLYASVTRPGGRRVILSVPVSGGAPRVLLADDAAHAFGRPDFAIDGQRIFFTLAAWTSTVWVLDLKH